MNQKVREYLINVALSNNGYTSYSAVAKACNMALDLNNPLHRNELSKILGGISEYELQEGRPLLSSVAIYKDGDHGDGFYKLCEQLGLGKASTLRAKLYGFVEGKKCQDYWKNKENFEKYYQINSNLKINPNAESLFNIQELDFFKLWAKQVYDPKDQTNIDAKNHLLETVWTKTSDLGAAIHDRLEGFEINNKRYWQQLGLDTSGKENRQATVFKPYTWVRIFRKGDADKSIFFTVGLDTDYDAFVYKLDHHVEKASSLSQEQKDLFKALVPKTLAWNEIEYSELITLSLGNLVDRMVDFILSSVEIYDMIMDAVWKNIVPEKIPRDTLIRRNPPYGIESLPEINPSFTGGITDYVEQQKENTELGNAGENLVIKYERDLLINERPDLANKIVKVLDGKGYDILSYNSDGSEKYIEVKTTSHGETTPFNLTITELIFMRQNVGKIYLYRLYNFDKELNTSLYYVLDEEIESKVFIQPMQYKVYKKQTKELKSTE